VRFRCKGRDETFSVMFTSGTTDAPRGVAAAGLDRLR
jgi:long-subunit acyl-CoA synthetase (AMP-forming)